MVEWNVTAKAVGTEEAPGFVVAIRAHLSSDDTKAIISRQIHENQGMLGVIEHLYDVPKARRSSRALQTILLRAAIAGHMARLLPVKIDLTLATEGEPERAMTRQSSHLELTPAEAEVLAAVLQDAQAVWDASIEFLTQQGEEGLAADEQGELVILRQLLERLQRE
ncbi:MAG: hypothetical protein QM692_21105 [Thermomicrobiales bacterium]